MTAKKQPGTGRKPGRKPCPPGHKKLVKGVRLTGWVWDWLDTQGRPRGTMLEEALIQVHGITAPANADKAMAQLRAMREEECGKCDLQPRGEYCIDCKWYGAP